MAYFAGYLDGEGCFRYRTSPNVQITSIFPVVLESFKKFFGGSVRLVKPYKDGIKSAYSWEVYGEGAIKCCEAVLPYLMEKRLQAEVLLEMRSLMAQDTRREVLRKQLSGLKTIDYGK